MPSNSENADCFKVFEKMTLKFMRDKMLTNFPSGSYLFKKFVGQDTN